MTGEQAGPPAVFDADAVRGLTGDPGDETFALVLLTHYRGLLPERVRRIATAMAGTDAGAAMDAVLSLKVASSTVGALELAEVAARLERLLRQGDLADARLVGAGLAGAADRADRVLGDHLGD